MSDLRDDLRMVRATKTRGDILWYGVCSGAALVVVGLAALFVAEIGVAAGEDLGIALTHTEALALAFSITVTVTVGVLSTLYVLGLITAVAHRWWSQL